MKPIIEKIAYFSFVINSLYILSIVILPFAVLLDVRLDDVLLDYHRHNYLYPIHILINITILFHIGYCVWFLYKFDRYSKSIFLLGFLNVLYAPIYFYRVKIKKRPLRNEKNKPVDRKTSVNILTENDYTDLTRRDIFDQLQLWSSISDQIKIQNSDHDLNLPQEMISKWLDFFVIDSEDFKESFSGEELKLLVDFDKKVKSNHTRFEQDFSDFTTIKDSRDWKNICEMAQTILKEINDK